MNFINKIRVKPNWYLSFCLLFLGMFCNAFTQDTKSIDQWLVNNVTQLGNHAVLMIYQNGKVVYSNAVNKRFNKVSLQSDVNGSGKNNKKWGTYTATTRLPIASCSKWFSAALVMTFVDEGKLQLTDSIGKYLPVFTQNGKGSITISECLSHLTGIKATEDEEGVKHITRSSSMQEAINWIAQLPMESEPGKTFHYSNLGLQIVAAVIEKISGQDFKTLFRDRIATPLQMNNTDFGNKAVPLAAGGAFSTTTDYIHFLTMILHHGMYNDKKILSENSIKQMQLNRVTPDVNITYSPINLVFGYGFGEWVLTDNAQKSFISSPGLFGSFPWVDYNKNYCAFLLTFNFHNEGREDRLLSLKQTVDAFIK